MSRLVPQSASLSGTQLIEASAGTGKTYTITTLYLRLILEEALEVDQILVVTYTNAATAELRERIRSRLREALRLFESGGAGPGANQMELAELLDAAGRSESRDVVGKRLVQALRRFDESAVFTIHGFCQRILQENAFECGMSFDTVYVTDERALFQEVSEDFWTNQLYDAPRSFVEYLRELRPDGNPAGPALLSKLARSVVSRPEMPVLPADVPTCDAGALARLEQEFSRTAGEATALWQSDGRQALEILAAAADRKALNKTSYPPARIRAVWGSQLDEFFEHVQPRQIGRLTSFKNCRTGAFEGKVRNDEPSPTHAFFDACEALGSAGEALLADHEARWLAMQREFVDYARLEVERRKQERGRRSFDDMLLRLRDALCGEGGGRLAERIRSKLPAALIDEFQDTDPIQYEIFRRIWHEAGRTLFLIGDPKQAIYAFRGADVFAYMRARDDAGGGPSTLLTNYRSAPALIGAVNALFEASPRPFVFERIPFEAATPRPDAKDGLSGGRATDAPLRFVFAEGPNPTKSIDKEWTRTHLYPWIAGDIAGWVRSDTRMDGRPINAGDVAVLCRTNLQARELQQELRRLNVPSVLQTDESVFDSDEALDVERLLRAVAEPADVRSLRAALATRLIGEDAAALDEIDHSPFGWDVWLELFHDLRRRWQREGPVRMIERVTTEHGAERRMLGLPGGERRLTNLLHIAELLQSVATEGRLGPLAAAAWLQRMRLDEGARSEGVGDGALIRLESDERAVTLVTIHRSKGLQYPIVYCPFLTDGTLLRGMDDKWIRYHDAEEQDSLKLDIGSSDRKPTAEWEAMAESMRLAYVALTRAQHRLIVVWGRFSKSETSPLALLLHSPPNIAEAGEDLTSRCAAHMKKLKDENLWERLVSLSESSSGQIAAEKLAATSAKTLARDVSEKERLEARVQTRPLSPSWRTSSFSGLSAGDGRSGGPAEGTVASLTIAEQIAESHPAAQGLDFDAHVELEGQVPHEAAEGPGSDDRARVLLHDFPAGTQAGTMIHEVLEQLDFRMPDPDPLRPLIEVALDRHGLSPVLAPILHRALLEVLKTPLGDAVDGLTLASLGREDRIDEMEFTLPVASRETESLTAERLAAVFRDNAVTPHVRAYAERIVSLGFRPLAGYLRGFVDLIFRHQGRFYVVDYKSNRLGEWADDYLAGRLEGAMAEHHYTLQYHLYVLALHRHLRQRLPGYDPRQHLGGVFYLFLRGMSPDHRLGSGIYYDSPPVELIEALSSLFGVDDRNALEGGIV